MSGSVTSLLRWSCIVVARIAAVDASFDMIAAAQLSALDDACELGSGPSFGSAAAFALRRNYRRWPVRLDWSWVLSNVPTIIPDLLRQLG